MKSFIVFALFIAAAAAAPASPEAEAPIISLYNDNIGTGEFKSGYETGNGIKANEEGVLKVFSPDSAAVVRSGRNSYTGPDGVQYVIDWVADENGYRASGAHLPVGPTVA